MNILNTTTDAIIHTKQLNFFYGYKREQALKDINVRIQKNKLTSIIGPSGSGKSTLLRVFNTIYKINRSQHAEGQVFYKGIDILGKSIDPIELRSEIGMVFQRPTPFPMSLYDNIAFPLKQLYKLSKEQLQQKVVQSLKDAALWDEVKDKLYETGSHLSGGQQQRLCFARTIALSPQVLLLDEPTSALDPLSKKQINHLIKNLKEKYTIIMVSHDITSAYDMSDQVIIMNQGEVIEQDDRQNIFHKPKQPFTRLYLDDYKQHWNHLNPKQKLQQSKQLENEITTV